MICLFFQFITYPAICTNPMCNNRERFVLNVDNSVFMDFQEIRIRETQEELPSGCTPRYLDIALRAEIVETIRPSDRLVFYIYKL